MGELLRALLKTGSGSAASLVLGMIAMKIIAAILGPTGVGLFSLLRQTQQTALSIGVLNGQMAVVQGTASRQGRERTEYVATTLVIVLAAGGLVGLGLLVLAPQLADWVIGRRDAPMIGTVRWLAVSVCFSVGAAYLTSVLNGYRAIGRVALSQVVNFGLLALLAYPAARLVQQGHPVAFAWQLTISALGPMLFAGWHAWRSGWLAFVFEGLRRYLTQSAARHFLSMTGTMLLTGLIGTVMPLAVRALAVHRLGLQGAGILDVAWTLSMAYVTLILTSFSTYYLPTLSQITQAPERRALVRRVSRLATLMMVPTVISVVTLKPLVVTLLYTGEFLPSLGIMRWMLIGDYLKVVSWVFSFTMVAYADMRTYLWTEAVWGTLMVAGAAVSVLGYGSLQGIGVTFVIVYATYLVYTVFYVYRRHAIVPDPRTAVLWLVGLVLVIGASAQTWNATDISWWVAGGWTTTSVLFVWVAVGEQGRQRAFAAIGAGRI